MGAEMSPICITTHLVAMSILSNHTKDMFLRRFYYPMRAPPYLFDWHTIQLMAYRNNLICLKENQLITIFFFSNLQKLTNFLSKYFKKNCTRRIWWYLSLSSEKIILTIEHWLFLINFILLFCSFLFILFWIVLGELHTIHCAIHCECFHTGESPINMLSSVMFSLSIYFSWSCCSEKLHFTFIWTSHSYPFDSPIKCK